MKVKRHNIRFFHKQNQIREYYRLNIYYLNKKKKGKNKKGPD
jgi:hypothetical protein